jgi:hypothetical protein
VPLLPNTHVGRLAVLVGIVLILLLVVPWYAKGRKDKNSEVTYPNAALVNPILGGLGALLLIYIAIRQARTAIEVARTGNRQAEIASRRHITDTFGKAVEQLGSDKMEVRIGGIYTLERLAREALASPQAADATAGEASNLYWTAMETLAAFVRERTRPEVKRLAKPRKQRIAESAYLLWKTAGMPESRSDEFWSEAVAQEARRELPATDVAAVLEVIRRRPEAGREREKERKWRLDLSTTDLRGADLHSVHLKRAIFDKAHLEGVNFAEAHLEHVSLREAHLSRGNLSKAHLTGADLWLADLNCTNLVGAHLEDTDLTTLWPSHTGDTGLTQMQIGTAYGNAKTQLPEGLARPAHWPAAAQPLRF